MVKEETVATPLQTVLRFAAQRDVEIKPGETTYLTCLPDEIREILKKNIIDAHSHHFKQLHPPTFQQIGSQAQVITATPKCDRIFMGYNKGATLFDLATGRTRQFPAFTKMVCCAAISSDGNWVLMGTQEYDESAPGPAILWDLRKRSALPENAASADWWTRQVLMGHTGVHILKMSSDGKRAVTCSVDGTSKVWDLSIPGNPLCFPLPGHTTVSTLLRLGLDGLGLDSDGLSSVSSLTLSPDGTKLLLGYEDGVVRFCDLSNLSDIKTDELEGHVALPIKSSALTTNGDFGFTASNQSAILWDLRTPHTGYRVNDRAPKGTGLTGRFLPRIGDNITYCRRIIIS